MLDVSVVGRWALVTVVGEPVPVTPAEVTAIFSDLVDRQVSDVTVDLGRVLSVDAGAVEALVAAGAALSAAGGRMVVFGASAQIAQVLTARDVRGDLHVFASPSPRGRVLLGSGDGGGKSGAATIAETGGDLLLLLLA